LVGSSDKDEGSSWLLQDAMGYPLNYSRHVWWRNRLLRYIWLTTGTTTRTLLPSPYLNDRFTTRLPYQHPILGAESLVVSSPKKGDLANMNNYQGILLIMATVLKSGVCDPQHMDKK
jgi:hypothetical protein